MTHIKLKDLLFEASISTIEDIERHIQRNLPSLLKREGGLEVDKGNGIISYRGRIAPDITSGRDYSQLKKEVQDFMKKLRSKIDANIEYSYFDEWVGFEIRVKPPNFKDPKVLRDLFGKPPKENVVWVDSRYGIILYHNREDRAAVQYAKKVEDIIYKDNLDDVLDVSHLKWKPFGDPDQKTQAKQDGTIIKV